MNKCLITKLKASTGNEDLSKYNVLTIKTKVVESPTVNSQWIGFGPYTSGDIITVNSSNVGLYKSGISGELESYPYSVNGYVERHFENKDGIIEIMNKYNLGDIVVGSGGVVRIKEIYGISMLGRRAVFEIEENEIDSEKIFQKIDKAKLSIFKISDNKEKYINKISNVNMGGFSSLAEIGTTPLLFTNPSIDNIADWTSLTTAQLQYFSSPGNISSFKNMTKLTSIYFSDKIQNTGDIMDFINPWIAAGRTSGKIQVYWLLGQKSITLNGSPITYPSGVSNAGAYLNWTSDGTVTFTAS